MLLDLMAAFLIRGLNLFFHMMPVRFNLWFARGLGMVAYSVSPKRNRITYANLKAAFASEKSPKELKRITKNAYKNLAQTFIEILTLTKVNQRYEEKFFKDNMVERLAEVSPGIKGKIFLSAHLGNWEIAPIISVMKEIPLHLLARQQKMPRLNELLNSLRESKGNVVMRKGTDVKNIFRTLRDGKSIGMLGDQNVKSAVEFIDFFDRPVPTTTSPFRFAQKSGACIFPSFMHRVKGPCHELILESPIIIKKGDDIIPYMQEYNRLLEKHIRQYPDQWLWMYKRWKMTPVRKVMVLDDGDKEYLKKSLAASDQFKLTREAEGYTSEQTEVNVVQIRFKNKKIKSLFNIVSPFFTSRCQGCMKCLKWALEHKSYEDAIAQHADIVISSGSALSSVDKLLRIENNAQSL